MSWNTHIPKFRRFVIQNFPFIEEDFDALTDYALICKVVEYLNKVIDSQNAVIDEVDDLNNAFNELKTIVDTYFDNLDVQEEINNKLDEMVEDGTLQRLLQARDFADVPILYFQTLFLKSRFIDGMENMNGGCVLPDNSVIQCTGSNTFYHYAADGTLLNSNTISGTGHCNGCCYNPKTGKVYIVSSGSGLDNHIMVMDPLTLTIGETIDATDRGYPAGAYGIVYNEQADEYIMTRWWGNDNTRYLWRVDNNFDLIQTVDTQAYDINSTSNIGRFGDYVGVNNMYTHQILLFNMNDLSYYKTVKIDSLVSDTWTITEEQWIDTRADGKIMLGFHASGSANPHVINTGTYVYAIFDPTKNYEQCPIKDTYSPKNEFYYIDHTYTANDRNGESSTPFNNVYEALNSSLRTKGCTGKVIFRFSNNTETIYTPVFTMNKSYTIWNPTRTINFFGAIAVNNGCSVYCDRPIQLQLLDNKINPFGSGDADIHCLGKMDLVGELSTVGNVTPTIVGAGDFIAQFESCGLDVENFYGNVTCTGNALNTDVADIIKNSRNTYNQAKFSKEYKGIKGLVAKNQSNEFVLPPLSKTIMAIIKITVGSNSYEPSTVWNPNSFSSVCINDSVVGKVNISIAESGRVYLYPNNTGGSIDRVKIISL